MTKSGEEMILETLLRMKKRGATFDEGWEKNLVSGIRKRLLDNVKK